MRIGFCCGLVLWGSLAIGCKDKEAKPTRDECMRASEHIADLIIAHYTANAEQWFDAIQAQPSEAGTGLPPTVDRAGFKAWLDTPEGKTWTMQRRGNTLIGTQQMVDSCVDNATKAQVKCLLASKSKDDVTACDAKHKRAAPTTAAPAAPEPAAPPTATVGSAGSPGLAVPAGATVPAGPGSAESK